MKRSFAFFALCAALTASAQTFTTWTTAEGLPTNNLRDIAIAANGDLWIATQLGVVRFDGTTFTTHNTSTHPGLANNSIEAIAVTAAGEVWAGTDVGVSVFDGTDYTTYTTADGLGDDQVNNIKQASNGDIWIGTINGATRYSSGTFTAFGSPDIPFGGVEYIAFADNGDVWLGGGLGGIIIYDGSSFSSITTADGLISNKIRSIAFDGDGNKWIGTAQGISVLDASDMHVGDHTRPFILPAPDTLNPVTDIVIDTEGTVWAGIYVDYLVTEGGVAAFDGAAWSQYESTDGLAGPNVRRMVVDANDDVWVTTSTGLTRITAPNIGIAETEAPDFGLYPNPASDQVAILAPDASTARAFVQLTDTEGRLVGTTTLSGGRATMDVSGLNAGVYVIRVGGAVRRLIVR